MLRCAILWYCCLHTRIVEARLCRTLGTCCFQVWRTIGPSYLRCSGCWTCWPGCSCVCFSCHVMLVCSAYFYPSIALEARQRRGKASCWTAFILHQSFTRYIKMVGTIRRPVQESADSSNSGAPPPPSYQAATSPTAARVPSSSSGNINAGAFQQHQQPANVRHSVAVTGNEYGRPHSQAQMPARPQSFAQPPGAPPVPPPSRQSFQQPPGPPPPQRAPSMASTHSSTLPAEPSNRGLQRANTQEDRMAICWS